MTNTRKRLGMWPHITTSCQIHINFLNSEHSQTCGMEKRCVLTQPVRMENCEKCDVGAPSTVITGNGWTSYSFLWKLYWRWKIGHQWEYSDEQNTLTLTLFPVCVWSHCSLWIVGLQTKEALLGHVSGLWWPLTAVMESDLVDKS